MDSKTKRRELELLVYKVEDRARITLLKKELVYEADNFMDEAKEHPELFDYYMGVADTLMKIVSYIIDSE